MSAFFVKGPAILRRSKPQVGRIMLDEAERPPVLAVFLGFRGVQSAAAVVLFCVRIWGHAVPK